MSRGISVLHSHSGIEKELKFPKHIVLVDECFGGLFPDEAIKPFRYDGEMYYKVPILMFVEKGGVFKNLLK